MPDRPQLEAMLVAHLGVLERMARGVCRRNGLQGADADDFVAWVRLRLIEQDYAILARFRGDSALPTYLATVVATLHRDYRAQRDGRWRPSAAALHAGPLAVRLERLVYRDRLPFDAAARVLQAQEVPPPALRELTAIFRALRARTPLRPSDAGPGALDAAPGTLDADGRVTAEEETARRRAVDDALARTLDGLADEDRVLLRLRFWEGASVADAARALDLPQKPLYRRLERLLARLREALEAAGVDARAVLELLGTDPADPADPAGGEMGAARPSNPTASQLARQQAPHDSPRARRDP